MADIFSKKKRSEIMSRIRGKDTKPELMLRHLISKLGVRFSSHYRIGGYRADIAFPSKRIAIFIDGCFWHGCPIDFKPPKSNKAYWRKKIADNIRRDKRIDRTLHSEGWKVLHFWEHEIKKPNQVRISKLIGFLSNY